MVNTRLVTVCRVVCLLSLCFVATQVYAASASSLSMMQAQSIERQSETQPEVQVQQELQRGIWVMLGKREGDQELIKEGPVFIEEQYQGMLANVVGVHKEDLNICKASSEDQSKIKDLRYLSLMQQQALGLFIMNVCSTDPNDYTLDIGCSIQAYEYLLNESLNRWLKRSGEIRVDMRDLVGRVQESLVAAYIRHFYKDGQIDAQGFSKCLSANGFKWNKKMIRREDGMKSVRMVLMEAFLAEIYRQAILSKQDAIELAKKMQEARQSLRCNASEVLVFHAQDSAEEIPVLSTPESSSRREKYIKRQEALKNTPNIQTNCARKLEPEFDATLMPDKPVVVANAPYKPGCSSSASSGTVPVKGGMKTFFRKPAVRWALFVMGAALCTVGGFGGREMYRRYKAAQLLTKAPAIVHVSLLSRLTAFLMRCKTALVG